MGVYLENTVTSYTPSPLNVALAQYERKQDAGNIFEGNQEIEQAKRAIEDYQLSLSERIDLIPLGYCAAYADRNILLAALVGSATRIVPFNAELGPHQGAHVGNERIVFDLTGTWTVHVMVGFRGVPPLVDGDGRVHIEVRVRHSDGSLASWWKVRGAPGREEVSLTCSRPVVITTPGMYVEVQARTGMTRHVDGGTAHSVLTVVRSSLDTDNPGVPEVPDEP